MGSNCLITVGDVAALLGISERTVHYHVRKGHLHPRYPKEQGLAASMMFHREEVAAAAEVWNQRLDHAGLMSRSVQSYALSRSLERRVQHLEELVGAQFTSTPTDEESVRSIYLEAKDDLKAPPADPDRIGYWTRFCMSVGEEFFDVLEAYTNNEKSWEVFHDLSRAIAEEVPMDLSHDPDLHATYRGFERARRNLRRVLFFHLQSRHGSKDAVKMFEEDVPSHEQILRFLSATTPGR
jgi:AcrR family transcriptional regulator